MYHYAGNNPIRYVDPDGRVFNLIAGVAGAAIGNSVLVNQYKETIQFSQNKLTHIFGKAEHKFSSLLKHFNGNQNKLLNAIYQEASNVIKMDKQKVKL